MVSNGKPLDLEEIRRQLLDASGPIDGPDAPYNWAALNALRAAELLLAEVERLRVGSLLSAYDAMSQRVDSLTDERDAYRAEVESLRRQVAERDAKIDGLGPLYARYAAERDVIEAAKAYEAAWTVWKDMPSRGQDYEQATLAKAQAHQQLLEATRAVDALSQPESKITREAT